MSTVSIGQPSLAGLQEQRWDSIVIGAGVAGSIVAKLLAERSRQVLLLDRDTFPRFKVCGGCWNQRGLAALADAGHGDVMDRVGAPTTDRIKLCSESRTVGRNLPPGRSVSRTRLDHQLLSSASAAGAVCAAPLVASHIEITPHGQQVRARYQGQSLQLLAKSVVIAAGLSSTNLLRGGPWQVKQSAGSRIGIGTVVPNHVWNQASPGIEPGEVLMAVADQGYVGMVHVEDNQIAIAAAVDRSLLRDHGGIESAVNAVLLQSGRPALPSAVVRTWRATLPLTRRVTPPAHHGIFLVGDAVGYIEPFTGEGMTWAATGAVALVDLVDEAVDGWREELAAAWSARLGRLVKHRQWVCRSVQWGLRHARVRRVSMAMIDRFPRLIDPLLAQINRANAKSVTSMLRNEV